MPKIRNLDDLLENGDVESRRIVLTIADRTLERLDAYSRIKSVMRLDGDQLVIGTRTWDLSRKRNVYLVGAGKAGNHMARAVDEVLGDRLTRGIAIVKIAEESDRFNRTELHVGGHPIPNQIGLEASTEILRLADQAGPDDLFICVVSGGSSALMNCPIEGITLEDEQIATDVLLKSGAGIYEINAVRRHISQTNGGRLAQRIAESGAELIGIGISDAVGNRPTGDIAVPFERYASTPIGPDPTTLDDARRVIEDYDLARRLPESVVAYLTSADGSEETPKSFPDNTYFVINTVPDSCAVAKAVAEEMGLRAVVLTTFLEGESRHAGSTFASIAREIQTFGNPVSAPCVVLAAGETTTTIPDSSVIRGRGGPGQELVVGFALAATRTEGAAMLSIDSEGTDGTSDVAGGICDSTSAARALGAGLNLRAALRHHATYEALDAIGDAVLTGNTGTNLCDLNILYVPAPPRRATGLIRQPGRIVSVAARQILDCKARPMLEVELHTEDGHVGRGAAPTGASVGVHEALVLRDDDPGEYGGLSVHVAVRTVEDVIAPAILGVDVTDQRGLDERLIELDGTSNKGRLGGNSVYSTSIAAVRAAAAVVGVPTYEYVRRTMGRPALSTVPVPSFNMINGGRYGDVTQPFNEFIVMPHRAETIAAAVESSIHLFDVLAEVIADRGGRRPEVASSYGYVAPSGDPRVVLELLAEAVERAALTEVMAFALDCASSEMYDSATRTYELNGRRVDSAELISYTKQLSEEFPLVFVEDLLDQDDWTGYPRAVAEIGRTIILGDDLIVTNRDRLERAAGLRAVDGFVLKPNQIGTITEALDCFSYAEENGLIAVPSGRSGGVIDDVVMDLSVGLAVPFQKNGAPRSGERIEKLNFLTRAAEAIPDCTLADLGTLVRF